MNIIRIIIGVSLFLLILFLFNLTLSPSGFTFDETWVVEQGGIKEEIKIPFYTNIDSPDLVIFYNEFSAVEGNTLVLPRVSNHGMKIYINDILVKQIGNFDHPTANTWNTMHIITFDPDLLKETNTLKIEMNCLYDAGIHIVPYIDNYENVSMRVYFFNFLNNHIYMIAFGGAIVIGIILLIVGMSFENLKKAYIYMALAAFCAGIYLFDFQLRASTGSSLTFLMFEKVMFTCSFLSTTFLLAGTEYYVSKKPRYYKYIFPVAIFLILILLLQSDLLRLNRFVNYANLIHVLNTALISFFVFSKKKAYLFIPTTFLLISIVFSVLILIPGIPFFYSEANFVLVGYSVFVSSIGFGLALVETYRDLHKRVEKTHLRSLKDPLTGAYNRGFLQEFIPDTNDLFVLTDIDHFKKINDKYGHDKGDEALKKYVETIVNRIRDNDFVVRYGGDEFLIILRDCSEETGRKIMDRIAKSLDAYSNFMLQISFGIVRYNDSLEKTISEADKRMYVMKGK
ncbi:MAG: GGDEF domain-containing protein [Atribacterota bacterium]